MQSDNPEFAGAQDDRRNKLRHRMQRPCRVAAADAPSGEMTGVTADISRSGMLVRLPGMTAEDFLPKVGETARIVIDLPPSANYAPRSLECTARVVRVADSSGDEPAMAFEIQRMKIRNRRGANDRGTPHLDDCIQ
jgi:hypothetical protein